MRRIKFPRNLSQRRSLTRYLVKAGWPLFDVKPRKEEKNMPNKGYRSLTIPEGLYERLKQYVEDSQGRYVSVSEVVRQAVWEHLQKAS